MLKKNRLLLFLFLIIGACELPPRPNQRSGSSSVDGAIKLAYDSISTGEEYIMVTTLINLPMFVEHDQRAFIEWGKEMNVKTSIIGPVDWNIEKQVEAIEQAINSKPAGILINGTDPSIAVAINKSVQANIPTVVYDAPIPNSHPHCFIGSNWYDIGYMQGTRMGQLIEGKGKVACIGILGIESMETGFQGFQDAVSKYPDIEYLGKFDDKSNVEVASRMTANLLAAHPDLAGIAGFDSNSGPGIGIAIKESNKQGKVKITCVDSEEQHVKLVREGVIDYLVGQKRELFTWHGAQTLYDIRHPKINLSANDEKSGIVAVPHSVNTGLVEIDSSNVNYYSGYRSN